MQLETDTTVLVVDVDVKQDKGVVTMGYDLYANDALVGQYDILLQFNGKSSKLNQLETRKDVHYGTQTIRQSSKRRIRIG